MFGFNVRTTETPEVEAHRIAADDARAKRMCSEHLVLALGYEQAARLERRRWAMVYQEFSNFYNDYPVEPGEPVAGVLGVAS